jgi:hypothetical protein
VSSAVEHATLETKESEHWPFASLRLESYAASTLGTSARVASRLAMNVSINIRVFANPKTRTRKPSIRCKSDVKSPAEDDRGRTCDFPQLVLGCENENERPFSGHSKGATRCRTTLARTTNRRRDASQSKDSYAFELSQADELRLWCSFASFAADASLPPAHNDQSCPSLRLNLSTSILLDSSTAITFWLLTPSLPTVLNCVYLGYCTCELWWGGEAQQPARRPSLATRAKGTRSCSFRLPASQSLFGPRQNAELTSLVM